MERGNKAVYGLLIGLSGLFAAAAIATLWPNPGASWDNVLGYRSLCTFAPIATAICALLAGATCTIRARLFGPQAGYRMPWTVPIVVGVILLAVIAASIPSYVNAKADATSGASVEGAVE